MIIEARGTIKVIREPDYGEPLCVRESLRGLTLPIICIETRNFRSQNFLGIVTKFGVSWDHLIPLLGIRCLAAEEYLRGERPTNETDLIPITETGQLTEQQEDERSEALWRGRCFFFKTEDVEMIRMKVEKDLTGA